MIYLFLNPFDSYIIETTHILSDPFYIIRKPDRSTKGGVGLLIILFVTLT
jgi:hypothetical protein